MKSAGNPFHNGPQVESLSAEELNALEIFRQGFDHELQDLIKLELTAEQMLGDEVQLVQQYLAEDANNFWGDVKTGLLEFELIAGQWLLGAADPTQVEWQKHDWWGGNSLH